MSETILPISFCFGVYNEEEYINNGLKLIRSGLDTIIGAGNYEIIVVENGSTDDTWELLGNIKDNVIKVHKANSRGLGLALRIAIEKSSYNNIVISALDLPFGFSDLEEFIKHEADFDIIFGSKTHPKSAGSRDITRLIVSGIYRVLLRSLFGVKILDTQGSKFLKKDKVEPILKYCTSNDAFFSSQLAIYGMAAKLRMLEVPVSLNKDLRPSRFHLLSDGFSIFRSMVTEYLRYRKIHLNKELFSNSVIDSRIRN